MKTTGRAKWIVAVTGPLLICLLVAVARVPGISATTSEEHAAIGSMLPHLTGAERELYHAGAEAFGRRISVQGDAYVPDSEIGLGPQFNGDSCAMCHAFPVLGGSSPRSNPQLESAKREGATNTIPAFVQQNGPIRQARLLRDTEGRLDGSVHPLFTIAGRRDASGCEIPQPAFEQEIRNHNIVFRIPVPLFGAGLIEAIPDTEIQANAQRDEAQKKALGIAGHPNRNAHDGSIGRFGWKAHTASLEAFAAEAYAVEEGVTNELFPQERKGTPANCIFNPTPEDRFLPYSRRPVDALSNVSRVAYFIRFLAPPPPPLDSSELSRGNQLFASVGCTECHTPALKTGISSHPALSEQIVSLYSDLLVHHMGAQLADGIFEGTAKGDEFRTAPLWGLGQRLFFLHDGRTTDLSSAILLHASERSTFRRSEANQVIARYRHLSQQDKDTLLRFLKAL